MNVPNIILATLRPEHFPYWEKKISPYDALFAIDFQPEIQVDSETTGLDSFHVEQMHTLQIGIPGTQYVFDLWGLDRAIFRKTLETKLCIFHNAAYDLPFLYKEGIFPNFIYDTLNAERLLTQGIKQAKRDLGTVVKKYLNIDIDKGLGEDITGGLKEAKHITYSGMDVCYLADVREEQAKLLARRGLEARLAVENRFVKVLAYMEYSGVAMDKDALETWIRDAETDEWLALKNMVQFGDINWRSAKQVTALLSEVGINEVNPKTGAPTTDEAALNRHQDKPVAVALLDARGKGKVSSTYGRIWTHYLQENGRVHTRYKQIVDTGRTGCGSTGKGKNNLYDRNFYCDAPFPNLQNIPKSMRKLFVPKKGNSYVICDYSSQESVLLADQSEEPSMLKFFQEKQGDAHCFITRMCFPELAELTDDEIKSQYPDKRDLCKRASFAIAYGGNGKTVAENLNIAIEIGEDVYTRYMKAFPRIKEYFDKCFRYTVTKGYMPMDTIGGKRYIWQIKNFIKLYNNRDFKRRYYEEEEFNTPFVKKWRDTMTWFRKLQSKIRKESVNTRIQGTGALMSKLAGIYIYDYICAKKLHGKVLIPLFVHDEWVTEQPIEISEEMAEVVQKAMEKAGRECLKHLTIDAIPKITDRWEK